MTNSGQYYLGTCIFIFIRENVHSTYNLYSQRKWPPLLTDYYLKARDADFSVCSQQNEHDILSCSTLTGSLIVHHFFLYSLRAGMGNQEFTALTVPLRTPILKLDIWYFMKTELWSGTFFFFFLQERGGVRILTPLISKGRH